MLMAPAMASAGIEWTKEKNPITTTQTLKIQGAFKTQGEYGGVECNAEADLKLVPGKTGQVTSFQPSGCQTFGFIKSELGCSVVSGKSEKLPWALTNTGTSGAVAANTKIHLLTNPGCILYGYEITAASLTFVPNNAAEFQSLQVNGKVETSAGTSTMTATFTPATAGYGLVALGSGVWIEKLKPITTNKQISISGDLRISNDEGGGFQCGKVSMEATLYPGYLGGEVTSMSFAECVTVGALNNIFGCGIENLQASLPWQLLPTATGRIPIPDLAITGTLTGGGCALGAGYQYWANGSVIADIDNKLAFSKLSFGEAYVQTPAGWSRLKSNSGLGVTPAATYGIG